ncbi:MAG: hypothetical protein JOZ53_23370 [Planctomycetaceae bacterium]|nr:hypothetical protein [Planctomycetaceae bacterium]
MTPTPGKRPSQLSVDLGVDALAKAKEAAKKTGRSLRSIAKVAIREKIERINTL